MTAIVLWSGGVESTWTLDHVLRATDHDTIALHVRKFPLNSAMQCDYRAVMQIAPYLRKTRRGFDLQLGSVQLPLGVSSEWQGILALMAANICLRRGDITDIYFGENVEEHELNRPTGRTTMMHYLSAFLFLPEHDRLVEMDIAKAAPMPGVHRPGVDKRKKELVRDLEPELREMVWSCQVPIAIGSVFRPCGSCFNCRLLTEANP